MAPEIHHKKHIGRIKNDKAHAIVANSQLICFSASVRVGEAGEKRGGKKINLADIKIWG